jgi:hypothetical protein
MKRRLTPDPFCDFMVFVFLHNKPTMAQEAILRKRLEDELNKLIQETFVFQAEALMKGSIVGDEKFLLDRIDASKGHDGRLKIEINGYEAELVDLVEMITYVEGNVVKNRLFKRKLKKLPFNRVFRYVAFYQSSGSLKADYDELDIFLMEERMKKTNTQDF